MHLITSELVNIQGYMWLTVYIHYFAPGSLKLQTKIRKISVDSLREEAPTLPTRRWLPSSQGAYPGYCLYPATNQCIPILCDCESLLQRWNERKEGKINDVFPNIFRS